MDGNLKTKRKKELSTSNTKSIDDMQFHALISCILCTFS